ncbi:hypothetical protein SAMN05421827_11662 [Pedobacter terrae]|uniref:Uncharacterized protein n=1 Tax=Pedobacter terrae TaxID=405671 RepID=A0A1G7ZIY2_9SPHI|nr:hypothetical protein SAMN05421827_11662 [Pedobacter terrae]
MHEVNNKKEILATKEDISNMQKNLCSSVNSIFSNYWISNRDCKFYD